MNKFYQKVKNFLTEMQEQENKKVLIDMSMNLIFKDNDTPTAIKMFQNIKESFEQEIKKRALESLTETKACEEYFEKSNKPNKT